MTERGHASEGCPREVPMIGRELAGTVLGMVLPVETLKSCESRLRRKKRPVGSEGGVSKIASVSWEASAVRIRGFLIFLVAFKVRVSKQACRLPGAVSTTGRCRRKCGVAKHDLEMKQGAV